MIYSGNWLKIIRRDELKKIGLLLAVIWLSLFPASASEIIVAELDKAVQEEISKANRSKDKVIYLREIGEQYPELYEILECESSFREWICNQEYGCEAGMGLAQIIPSTLKYCEQKLDRSLYPFQVADNLDCAIWLYINEGNRHWESSQECWDNK